MNENVQDPPADVEMVELVELTASVVAAYLSHNPLAVSDVPAAIETIHKSFAKLAAPGVDETVVEKLGAAAVRRSITPDALISFLDGRSYKTLKRHLTGHGLTPDAYREKFGLPADYPMVAASYSAARTEMAQRIGLGRKRAAPEAPTPEPQESAPGARRGRPKKA